MPDELEQIEEVPVEIVTVLSGADASAEPGAPAETVSKPRRRGFRAAEMYWGLLLHFGLSGVIIAVVVLGELYTRGDLQMLMLCLPMTAFFLWWVYRRDDGARQAGLAERSGKHGWGDVVGMWVLFRPVMWVATLGNRLLVRGMEPVMEYLGLDFLLVGVAESVTGAAADWITATTLALHGRSGLTVAILFACIVFLAPVGEELWFRGVGLAGYRKTGSDFRAVFWTSLVFGLIHGVSGFLPAAALGALFAVVRIRTGSLYPAMVLHAANNCFAFFVVAAPVIRRGQFL